MKLFNLIFLIICILTPVFMIVWKIYKVSILRYVSRWEWGVKLIKSEYFRTMVKREQNKVRYVKKAVRLAKLRNQSSNLKQYVIELKSGGYWYGTLREFTQYQKEHRNLKGIWPPRDSVFQTR